MDAGRHDDVSRIRSLFVVGLPRSLTTQVFHSAVTALGLATPAWTSDGEILNGRRLALFDEPASTDHRFTPAALRPATARRIGDFLRDAVTPCGNAYKDVVQPFIVADELARLDVATLRVRRPLADVAMAMVDRGWNYPQAAATAFTGTKAVIEGLIRAADVLSRLRGQAVDFGDLIADERSLEEALSRLYPGVAMRPPAYIDGAFRRTRADVLARRSTAEYQALVTTVAEVSAAIEIAVPEGWAMTAPASRSTPPAVVRARKPALLVVGDAVAPTGFSRVTHGIISRLDTQFDVHQLGVNYGGDPHIEPWKIYPAGLGGDAHGIRRIADLVATVDPDVILMVNDIGIVGSYLSALARNRQRARTVAYIPIDTDPIPAYLVNALCPLDRLVLYNDFAARTLQTASAAVAAADPSFRMPSVEVIGHGVDTQVFHPLFALDDDLAAGRRAVRQTLMPLDETFHRSFVVLNANRNQPRKRIDITMAGFARFAADKPAEVKLFLHMGTRDQGWDVIALAQRYGIADRVLVTSDHTAHPNLPSDVLNRIYNACDVGINTAECEGWGLPSFEHAATGAAQLVPGHTGPQSIWGGAADFLEPTLRVTNPTTDLDAHLISAATVADALDRLYGDRDLLRKRSLDAFRHATRPTSSWDHSAASFAALITSLIRSIGP